MLTATGIGPPSWPGIRYDPHDSRRGDVDLWRREITVRGKGGRPRVVRIGHGAARALDRYLRIRARHEQAHRPQLWLGVHNRGPMARAALLDALTAATVRPELLGQLLAKLLDGTGGGPRRVGVRGMGASASRC